MPRAWRGLIGSTRKFPLLLVFQGVEFTDQIRPRANYAGYPGAGHHSNCTKPEQIGGVLMERVPAG